MDDCQFMQMLYVEHAPMMYRIAHRFAHDEKDVEDVVSSACEMLIRHLERLRMLSPPARYAYIVSAVKTQAFMIYRKHKTEARALKRYGESDDSDLAPEPDQEAIQRVTLQEVVMAIRQLSERDQDILRMKYFENMSTPEIATRLGVQQSSVPSKVKRVRRRLYAALQEISDEQ